MAIPFGPPQYINEAYQARTQTAAPVVLEEGQPSSDYVRQESSAIETPSWLLDAPEDPRQTTNPPIMRTWGEEQMVDRSAFPDLEEFSGENAYKAYEAWLQKQDRGILLPKQEERIQLRRTVGLAARFASAGELACSYAVAAAGERAQHSRFDSAGNTYDFSDAKELGISPAMIIAALQNAMVTCIELEGYGGPELLRYPEMPPVALSLPEIEKAIEAGILDPANIHVVGNVIVGNGGHGSRRGHDFTTGQLDLGVLNDIYRGANGRSYLVEALDRLIASTTIVNPPEVVAALTRQLPVLPINIQVQPGKLPNASRDELVAQAERLGIKNVKRLTIKGLVRAIHRTQADLSGIHDQSANWFDRWYVLAKDDEYPKGNKRDPAMLPVNLWKRWDLKNKVRPTAVGRSVFRTEDLSDDAQENFVELRSLAVRLTVARITILLEQLAEHQATLAQPGLKHALRKPRADLYELAGKAHGEDLWTMLTTSTDDLYATLMLPRVVNPKAQETSNTVNQAAKSRPRRRSVA